MKITDNTILITGGGSGIGRGLADAFHVLGNQVIISARTQSKLDETCAANPGMRALTVDLADPADINSFAVKLVEEFPALNLVSHNAGIMGPESLLEFAGTGDAEAMVTTNLLGPIRLNAALLPTLKTQPRATILTVSSGLAMVPLAGAPTTRRRPRFIRGRNRSAISSRKRTSGSSKSFRSTWRPNLAANGRPTTRT